MVSFHTLKVKAVKKETPDCVSIAFDMPESLKEAYLFKPGQYLTLKKQLNGEEVRRSYSICASPHEEILRVAVKKVEGGKFSTFANDELQSGEELEVLSPMGNFTTDLDPENENHYVAFAAGSGITPVLGLLKAILHEEPKSYFTLFYGNRGVDSIIFRDEIESLKNKHVDRLSVHHVLSRENLGAKLFSGRIDSEKCEVYAKLLFNPEEVAKFFICGPEEMIHDIRETLEQQKIDSKKIKFELFTSPTGKLGKPKTAAPKRTVDPSKESKVTIKLDGDTIDMVIPYGGDSILDTALKKGADLPFACKGGVCCTCRAKLIKGDVDMDVNYALEPDEVKAGFILTCQSHPRSPELFVDFDEK